MILLPQSEGDPSKYVAKNLIQTIYARCPPLITNQCVDDRTTPTQILLEIGKIILNITFDFALFPFGSYLGFMLSRTAPACYDLFVPLDISLFVYL